MNATAHKAIIYDDNCPLCCWYTDKFVSLGLLKEENRLSFTQLTQNGIIQQVEMPKGKHEIPLVDLSGGDTIYGLDSLVFILRQKIPFIGWLLGFKPVYEFFKSLYSMVSYNRRIIVPSATCTKGIDCTPDFHARYRFVFLVFAALVATLISYAFGQSLGFILPIPFTNSHGLDILTAVGTGWLVQGLLAVLILKGVKRWDYLGQLATLMIMGVLVLVPGIIAVNIGWHYWWIPAVSVAISAGLMLREHYRRMPLIGLGHWWTAAWLFSLMVSATACLLVFYG